MSEMLTPLSPMQSCVIDIHSPDIAASALNSSELEPKQSNRNQPVHPQMVLSGNFANFPAYKMDSSLPLVISMNERPELKFSEVFSQCKAPQFERCQKCCGLFNVFGPGCGIWGGALCGCYGRKRAGCLEVGLAGLAMSASAILVYGWAVACIVGCKMMK
ncbi:Cysteine-rich_membrane protein 2 [Hexamita inflata]|uniref:Cysteine-rich membrane protein 2 n=1 Tax=Hexamita inflata TaxID=28002 RepID=A0AA86NAZ1_9EUKA|nr:Cysteine-rich membrane protein 2 [Hexamita inflata]